MKKKLVYKSKHGDIPIIIRDYVPDGELWLFNGETPIELFDKGMTIVNINTQTIKKVKFITKFKKRRFGKMESLDKQKPTR